MRLMTTIYVEGPTREACDYQAKLAYAALVDARRKQVDTLEWDVDWQVADDEGRYGYCRFCPFPLANDGACWNPDAKDCKNRPR